MTRFKKIAVAALAVTLTGAVALPAIADRGGHGWGKGSGHKWGMSRGHHSGGHGRGMMAMRFMERFDTDADGKVTQTEIDATVAEMYGAADADSSGGVTLEEFKAAYARELSDRKVRAFQRLDTDGDGSVTKAEFESRGGGMRGRRGQGMRPGMMGQGQGMRQGMGQGRMGQGMDDDDRRGRGMRGDGKRGQNQAGREARQEAREARQAARAALFSEADANSDNALSLDEFEAVWVERSDRRMVRMFQRLDRDGDLTVTRTEVEGPTSKIVSRMDRNGDGALSMEDHRRHGGKWGQGKRGGN
ncbi:EF-hand domain-containing protein [Stappia sp. ES.058]|uniref:EF-hand domain-containing protein n=1 Tax=Stappia sp. ES.058 TaxID=1881061 RepID=UPI0008793457|nr:EF-hand domain-containing protein [Stappia sp. ES.058]SDT97857.1 EF hand [Stappia sp. ES.058]